MTHISDRFTVVLDANVLYPFLVRDVLLSFAYAGLFRARWTNEIMDEWVRSLTKDKPDKEKQILRTAEIMNNEFPEALVEGYERLIPALELPDPNDRHVLAAALKVGAHSIVTENLRDFPEEILSPLQIEVRTADEFLLSTFELYQNDAIEALREMRQRYKAPPYSSDELNLSLIKAGLVRTASELKPHLKIL